MPKNKTDGTASQLHRAEVYRSWDATHGLHSRTYWRRTLNRVVHPEQLNTPRAWRIRPYTKTTWIHIKHVTRRDLVLDFRKKTLKFPLAGKQIIQAEVAESHQYYPVYATEQTVSPAEARNLPQISPITKIQSRLSLALLPPSPPKCHTVLDTQQTPEITDSNAGSKPQKKRPTKQQKQQDKRDLREWEWDELDKPVKTYIPKQLDIPEHLQKYEQQIKGIAGLIRHQHIVHNRSDDDFMPLKREYLRNQFGQATIDILLPAGATDKTTDGLYGWLVECDFHKEDNVKCYGYRLTEQYRDQQTRLVTITDPTITKKIRKQRRETLKTDTMKRLARSLQRFTIDDTDFHSRFQDRDEYEVGCNTLQLFRDKQHHSIYLADDFSGRVYTTITNMKKCFRSMLRIDGERVAEIDVSSSQPLLVGMEMIDHNNRHNITHTDTLNNYLQWVQSGKLYDMLADITQEDTDHAKIEVMRLMFTRPRASSTMKQVWRKLWPDVVEFMDNKKTKKGGRKKTLGGKPLSDKKRLAWILQHKEKSIIVDMICKEIFAENPQMAIATVHDSIVCAISQIDYVRDVMLRCFSQWGVVPNLKTKLYTAEWEAQFDASELERYEAGTDDRLRQLWERLMNEAA